MSTRFLLLAAAGLTAVGLSACDSSSGPTGTSDKATRQVTVVGAGQVIKGWDQGVPGMRVGGQRRLVLPPDLAYGSSGAGTSIPPNATLVFDIGLLSVQ